MTILDELDGVPTEAAKGVLQGFVSYHQATATPHRKQKGKPVYQDCGKCGRQKYDLLGGERRGGMLQTAVPTRMVGPGREICNCDSHGQHPPAPAGEFKPVPVEPKPKNTPQMKTGRSPLDLGGDKTK